MAAGVFISFQPEDAAWAARIRDSLKSRTAPDDLGRGIDFANALVTRARDVDFVLLIIGNNWLADINDKRSPIRIEIEAALARKIPVVPVLVDEAAMPERSTVPHNLEALAELQPFQITPEQFNSEMEQIANTLRARAVLKVLSRHEFGAGLPSMPPAYLAPDLGSLLAATADVSLLQKWEKWLTARALTLNAPLSLDEMAGFASARRSAVLSDQDRVLPKLDREPGLPDPNPAPRASKTKRTAAKKAAKKVPKRAARGPGQIAIRPNPNALPGSKSRNKISPAPVPAPFPPPEAVGEIVECSVFGPPAGLAGKTILIQVFLQSSGPGGTRAFSRDHHGWVGEIERREASRPAYQTRSPRRGLVQRHRARRRRARPKRRLAGAADILPIYDDDPGRNERPKLLPYRARER